MVTSAKPAATDGSKDVQPPGRVPLVIGVTGHRDIPPEDDAIYAARLSEFFDELRGLYPNTPLRVVSALAEGADRLVADVAAREGCELVVPLPLAESEYERDFPDSLDEFRRLKNIAGEGNVFALPLVEGNTEQSVREHGPDRDRQYARLGAFIASHTHILVALWDGTENHKVGGTSQVIRFKLNGVPAPYVKDQKLLDPVDNGPVFLIQARRKQASAAKGEPVQEPGVSRWLCPVEKDKSDYTHIYEHMDKFNGDPARRRCADIGKSKEYLIPGSKVLRPPEQSILDIYGFADTLALHYQRVAHRTLTAILCLAGAMALAFEIYAHLYVERFVLALYPVFFLAIAGLYLWHRRVGAHGKYLDYRALAEGLRVQLFWRLAGLFEDVSQNYLRKQNDELQWIREGLRAVNTLPPPQASDMELVYERWTKDQEAYFKRGARRQHARLERLERFSSWLYGTGLVTSVAAIGLWDFLANSVGLHHVLIVVMGFTPIVAALWVNYAEKTGLHAQSKQYARFAAIFGRGREQFDALRQEAPPAQNMVGSIENLVRELGKEALIENGDWVLLRRERPIEIPKG